MNLFGAIGNALAGLFGGNKKQSAPTTTTTTTVRPQRQVVGGNQYANPNFQTPAAALVKPTTTTTTTTTIKPKPQDDIEALTQKNLPAAKQKVYDGTNFIDRLIHGSQLDKIAENQARTQAITQYQDKNGYNADPNVQQVNRKVNNDVKANADSIKQSGQVLDAGTKIANAGAQVLQYVPVAGSVLNGGLAAAEALSKATGHKGYADSLAGERDQIDFGMNRDQFESLDAATKNKLNTLRGIGIAASPLDLTGLGGLAKTEALKVAKNGVVQLVKKGAVDDATKTALKGAAIQTAKGLGVNTAIGTGVSAAGQEFIGGKVDPLQAFKDGALIGGTSQLVSPAELRKAAANDARSAGKTAVSSANPNQIEDATKQITTENAANAQEVPDPGTNPVQPPEPLPMDEGAMNDHETAVLAQLNKDSKNKVLSPEEQAMRTSLQQKADNIAVQNGDKKPEMADPAEVPTISNTPSEQAPAAPRSFDAVAKNLGANDLKGGAPMRDKINLDDLKQKAAGLIADTSDDDLKNMFSGADKSTLVRDPQSFSVARAALDRLYAMKDDPIAQQHVSDILDSMAHYESKSGQGLRIAQEEFDNMPLPMKVRYITKKIDSANKDTKNYQPLAENPEAAKAVEATVTKFLTDSQSIAERAAGLENQLNSVADEARNGTKTSVNVGGIVKQLNDERRKLDLNNGELVKYYSQLVPGATKGQRVNDVARRFMLSSLAGRINDVVTTGANIGHLGATNITQALLSAPVNLIKKGAVSNPVAGVKQFFTGTGRGLQKAGDEFAGRQSAGDLQKSLQNEGRSQKSGVSNRSNMRVARGPIGRTIQAATELATNASEGVKAQRIYQLADKEAARLNLKGDLRRQYAEARAAVPSPEMRAQGELLHREMNNLNDNPVSRTLTNFANGIDNKSAVGGFIKNQVLPFTSWVGGNIYNSVTDKNVVASTYKTVRDFAKGDVEGGIRNLAKGINGAASAYAIGYSLTKAGIITNEDAEGYNDTGAYFHIPRDVPVVGGHYIPVNVLGFWAPNVMLGNAAYNGLNNSDDKKSPAQNIAEQAENLLKSIGASGLGLESNLVRSYQTGSSQGKDITDGVAQFAGGAAGQFIPAITGDINAGLNLTPLNPTREAADTKAVDPNSPSGTAKDVKQSAINSLVNRIPVASQLGLPRKQGVAANDMIDRVSRGDHETDTQVKAKADAKTEAEVIADNKKNDVPYYKDKGFDDAIQARLERGEYDKVLTGLQQEYDAKKADKNVPASKLKDLDTKIKQASVLKDGNWDYGVVDLYKQTSLSEWRNMGDPDSDSYDPDTYQKLYNYDKQVADKGISKNTDDTKKSKQFFFAKDTSKADAKKAATRAADLVKSNTLGSVGALPTFSFGDLGPKKISDQAAQIPKIQKLKASDLVKKRAITITKA